jgi:hypothetical protein
MNGEPISIEMLPDIIATGRFEGVKESIESIEVAPPESDEVAEGITLASPEPRLEWSSANRRAGDLWEMVSYLVLWISGWIGVGLCFR